jgi:hypothetical protein
VYSLVKSSFTELHRRVPVIWRVAVIVLFSAISMVQAGTVPPELSYFIGIWTIAPKEGPKGNILWTVKEDIGGEWLTGTVDKDGNRTSVDHWRMNSRGIERHVFMADGTYIKMNGSGWKTGKMIFTGVAYAKAGEYRMRETLFRESDTRFRALWEKQGADGVWTTFSDEICTK